jgi:glycosyltransferase involved in cell wall biosynthesis
MTVIDVAGALTGGAARWRQEAASWVEHNPAEAVRIVGTGHRVEPRWLVQRELLARDECRIAANNVSWVTGSGERVVLLVNALHFLYPGEADCLPRLPAGIYRQVPVVRMAARRADKLIVPCTEMQRRVAAALPETLPRIRVRHHPITVRQAPRGSPDDPFVLYPGIPAPHKDLVGHLSALVDALEQSHSELKVAVTALPESVGSLAGHPKVAAIGVQSLAAMDRLWAEASAVYAPTTVEAFGYPLAEARAMGMPVIAVDNAQNREIGGAALVAFSFGDRDSLVDAVIAVSERSPAAEPGPFEPDAYFRWLVDQ